MKKIFLFIQISALMAGLPAFAISGGPFDNGTYSILLERAGVYEAAYSFKNGSGYSQWTADNSQGESAAGGTLTSNLGQGSLILANGGGSNNANRTVLYYKGVTYFGAAMGQVDYNARTIQGFGNASSDYTLTSGTSQSTSVGFVSSTSSAFSTDTVVSSGRSYTANINWTGKITDTTPQLRFSGSGELAIIAPNGSEAIASLAYTGYSDLIDAINQSVSQVGQAAFTTFNPGTYTTGAAAIAGILGGTAGTAATPETTLNTPTYAQATNTALMDTDNNPATAPVLTTLPVDVNGNGINNDDLVKNGQATVVTAATAEVAGTPSLASYLDGTGPDNSYEEATIEKVEVTGYMRYF